MIVRFFKNLFECFEKRHSDDPVYSCEVYRDKSIGSCAHVDGPLCDFPDCSILKNYREAKENDCSD